MSKVILISIFIFFLKSPVVAAQDRVYIYFNTNSSEMCDIPKSQQGRYHGEKKVKKYKKIKSLTSDRPSQFFICNELFLTNNEKEVEICSINYLKNIEFSKIKKLLQKVNEINPLYPDKVFDTIYIVEKINDREIAIYDVKWQYYVE